MYKLFAIMLASSFGCTFAQVPNNVKSESAAATSWVEPDIFLRVTPLMVVNLVYGVSITFKNTSFSAWIPTEVSLKQTSPSTTWFQNQHGHPVSAEENRVQLPQTVPAGGKVTFTFQVRAPAISGRHVLAWQLYNSSGPLLPTATSREIVIATLEDVTPPGQLPPIDARPFPSTPPPFR